MISNSEDFIFFNEYLKNKLKTVLISPINDLLRK
jgi:hypothetical protein